MFSTFPPKTLLYDIAEPKTIKQAFSRFYALIKHDRVFDQSERAQDPIDIIIGK